MEILMSTLTTSDMAKSASSGPFKGKKRKDIFNLKIKSKSPFLLDDGKGNTTAVQGVNWDDKTNTLTAKLGTKTFTTSLRYIIKDIDFGGSPTKKDESGSDGGTVGGKEVEVFSEAFFCYYFALKNEGKLSGVPFRPILIIDTIALEIFNLRLDASGGAKSLPVIFSM